MTNPTPGPLPEASERGSPRLQMWDSKLGVSAKRPCFIREQENPHPRPPTPIKGEGEKSRVYNRFDVSLGRGMKANSFA